SENAKAERRVRFVTKSISLARNLSFFSCGTPQKRACLSPISIPAHEYPLQVAANSCAIPSALLRNVTAAPVDPPVVLGLGFKPSLVEYSCSAFSLRVSFSRKGIFRKSANDSNFSAGRSL